MKVLIDVQGAQGSSRHSGLGRYTRELALALIEARGSHEVHVLLNGLFAEAAAELEALFTTLLGPGRVHRFHPPAESHAGGEPYRPLRRAAEWLRAEAIARIAPDLVLIGSLFEGWNESLVTTWPEGRARPCTVAMLHDLIPLSRRADYLDGAWARDGLVPWYWRCVLELTLLDGLLCNSEATRQEGLSLLPLPAERLITIGAGVAARFFAPSRGGPPPVPGRYLLCVGLGDIRKNEGRLMQAMALLPPGLGRDLKLVVTGKVPAEHILHRAAEAGLPPGAVIPLGLVPEEQLPDLYRHAACCVVPSLAEGFGLPLAEAMACGTPVAASRAGALPEVAGREDVLFDPLDPADMARVLARILGDPAFAAELKRHGPAQAARFTWPAVAERAWRALEQLAGPGLPARPSLALSGPMPPTQSGIADYTGELLPALARHYAITLVSEERPTDTLAAGFPWLPPPEFARQAWRFDRVLHQIGNSHLHHFQHEGLLPLRPAVVVLHDAALPEYRRWAAREAPEKLLAALYRNHGYPAWLAALQHDPGMIAQSLPLSADVLAAALAVILHSEAARELLRRHCGPELLAHSRVVPHLRRLPRLPSRAEARARLSLPDTALVVASFGSVLPKKLPQRVVAGFAAARLGASARLVFVGEGQQGIADVIAREAAARGVAGRVVLTEGLPRRRYEEWLAAADIAVQLRARHQGESSGAVADAMAAGLPCIVNASGSLAELPRGAVAMLPAEFSDAELGQLLAELAADPLRRAELGAAARRHVAEALAPERVALLYRDVIEAAHAESGLLRVLRALAALPGMTMAEADALGDALAAEGLAPRQPCLFVSAAGGWERSVFADLQDGRRPEPVRLEGGCWMSDHAGLARALGLPAPAAPDRRVAFRPGDAARVGPAERAWLPAYVLPG
ncbi:MAG: glycosyltransferase [Rhodovarius sp.]|nr:glycosyltransferase [Rhodovarius sp.]